MDRLYVSLPTGTIEDLDRLGHRQLRSSRQQAAYLILDGLARERRRLAARTGLVKTPAEAGHGGR
jgi:hypothetical protein